MSDQVKLEEVTDIQQQENRATPVPYAFKSEHTDGRKRIVILGAGAGGVTAAQSLVKTVKSSTPLHVVLVDKKDYFEVIPAALRSMVDPDYLPKVTRPLQSLKFNKNGHIFETIAPADAVSVNSSAKELVIARHGAGIHESVTYDYLILATGASYSSPYVKAAISSRSIEERRSELNSFTEKLRNPDNNHIVVVGGGTVGVELVGELIDFRKKNKDVNYKITIVHSNKYFVERANSASTHKYISKYFAQAKVEMIMEDRVVIDEKSNNTTDLDPSVTKTLSLASSGKTIDATMVLRCLSSRPSTQWLVQTGSNLEFETNGAIKVHDTLQATTDPRIFVVGDCNNIKCEKLAFTAKGQADIAVKNIATLLKDPEATKLATFKPMKMFAALVSLGSSKGAMVLNGKVPVWGRPAGSFKNKVFTMLVNDLAK